MPNSDLNWKINKNNGSFPQDADHWINCTHRHTHTFIQTHTHIHTCTYARTIQFKIGLNIWDSYKDTATESQKKKLLLIEGTKDFFSCIRPADPKEHGFKFFTLSLPQNLSLTIFLAWTSGYLELLLKGDWMMPPNQLYGPLFVCTQIRCGPPHSFFNGHPLSSIPLSDDLTQALPPSQPRPKCTPLEYLRKANPNITQNIWKHTYSIPTYT